jgi:type II secretory pathway pseudopilin PulG
MASRSTQTHRREAGFALLVTMVTLALVGTLALASLETVMRDRQVAGYQKRSKTALYAAEAGVASATGIIRRDAQALAPAGLAGLESWDPVFPTETAPQALGSVTNPPVFYRDPDAAKAVRYIDRAGPCWAGNIAGAMSMNIGGGQNIIWLDAMWDVRTTGLTANGSSVDIDAVVTSCHPFNS